MKPLLDHRTVRPVVRRTLDAVMVITGLGVAIGAVVLLDHAPL